MYDFQVNSDIQFKKQKKRTSKFELVVNNFRCYCIWGGKKVFSAEKETSLHNKQVTQQQKVAKSFFQMPKWNENTNCRSLNIFHLLFFKVNMTAVERPLNYKYKRWLSRSAVYIFQRLILTFTHTV